MATQTIPSFDEFNRAMRGAGITAPLQEIRDVYKKRYDRDAVFTSGPAIDEFRDAIRKQLPDASLDDIDQVYEDRYNTLPWTTDVARAAKRGVGGWASTIGGLSHAMGAEGFGQKAMDWGHGFSQANLPEAALSQRFLRDDNTINLDLLSRPDFYPQALAEGLVSMGPSLGGGLAARAALKGLGAKAVAQNLAATGIGTAIGGSQEGFGGT